MTIKKPCGTEALRALWQEAFGDEEVFLDAFFETAYSPERCLCVMDGGTLLGALYWLDAELSGQKWAYLYAVATARHSRGKGVCHALMGAAHKKLKCAGYAGTLLVPGTPALGGLYQSMGYAFFGGIREENLEASSTPVAVREVDGMEYAALRRQLLPVGGVVQEQENLAFLQTQARLYAGEGFVLAAKKEDERLIALEFLGDPSVCPGLLTSLSCGKGVFRIPGEKPFAMCMPLKRTAVKPTYFGFAFD